jgi:ATP:corrinoid adenosyltransferase
VDEINVALKYGLVALDDIIDVIHNKPERRSLS